MCSHCQTIDSSAHLKKQWESGLYGLGEAACLQLVSISSECQPYYHKRVTLIALATADTSATFACAATSAAVSGMLHRSQNDKFV